MRAMVRWGATDVIARGRMFGDRTTVRTASSFCDRERSLSWPATRKDASWYSASFGPGEPFGELCFCAPQKRLYRETYARAVVESEAGEVKLTDFMDYLQSDREALVNLVFIYCVRLSDAQHRLEALAQRGAVERLGRLLLHLANTRGIASDENAEEVILSVSHDELAKMAAMSRPHVTVTMGALRRRGLVGYGRNRPLVVNVEALAKYLNR